MDSPKHGLILPTIFMLLVFHSKAANAPPKLVEDICNQTVETGTTYEDCVDALELDQRTKKAANLQILAEISIQLAISNATDTRNFINNLLKDTTTPALQESLKICSSLYVAITSSFKSALQELNEDVDSANYDIKVAGDEANECENELARDKAGIPSVTTRNNYVKLYSNVGSVITELLG